jgi:DNA-binding GntR family transcriptional regulator
MQMPPLAPKADLTMQTLDAIRAAILSGDLAPGTPLAQEELAARLGVSRQPISHALVLLKREGLVVERGRKGQMVAPIDAGRLLGLYQVRSALDRLAAQLAARRVAAGEARPARLEALIDDGKAAVAGDNIAALVEADVAFHTALYDLSGNPEIEITANVFWPHMRRSMRVVLEDQAAWNSIWREHAAIAEAVRRGDEDEAGALAFQHADRAGETTYRRLNDRQAAQFAEMTRSLEEESPHAIER